MDVESVLIVFVKLAFRQMKVSRLNENARSP